MEIINEEDARAMIARWKQLPVGAQKREIGLAVQKLELGAMYYEQKGNDKGVRRSERCILILRKQLDALER
ncbi:MAG: hypothetical protein SCH71_14045 [Desulfobulbaceae bacterium]|nr:hypothetical protein [Desulfobulbaceae bacterium]